MRKINRDSKDYDKYLAIYLNTKHGRAFTYHILSQLIRGFEVDHKSKIADVKLETEKALVLDFDD